MQDCVPRLKPALSRDFACIVRSRCIVERLTLGLRLPLSGAPSSLPVLFGDGMRGVRLPIGYCAVVMVQYVPVKQLNYGKARTIH